MTRRALIVGHGAIGSVFAGALAQAGFEISALSSSGVSVLDRTRRLTYVNEATIEYSYSTVGPSHDGGLYDMVILAVKTTALADVLPTLTKFIGDQTTLVSAMNGVPWWFSPEAPLAAWSKEIPSRNIVGCVINLAATKTADDEVEMRGSRELVFGDVVPGSNRVDAVVSALSRPWVQCRSVPDIRINLWQKLLNNASVNPISALCMANCGQVTSDVGSRNVIRLVMKEVIDVGVACGIHLDVDVEERINWSASYGAFKTSMLQDLEAKRALEVDALLSSVIELGARAGVATPYLSCVTSLVTLRSKLSLSTI